MCTYFSVTLAHSGDKIEKKFAPSNDRLLFTFVPFISQNQTSKFWEFWSSKLISDRKCFAKSCQSLRKLTTMCVQRLLSTTSTVLRFIFQLSHSATSAAVETMGNKLGHNQDLAADAAARHTSSAGISYLVLSQIQMLFEWRTVHTN